MKIRYRSNAAAGVASIALGVICLILIPQQIGEDYAVTYGITSRTVPCAVAALWIVCGAALLIQSLLLKKDVVKELDVKKEAKALPYMAVLLVYAILFTKSFLLSTAFLGVVTLVFLRSRRKLFYAVVLALVAALYLLFSQVLHIQMP